MSVQRGNLSRPLLTAMSVGSPILAASRCTTPTLRTIMTCAIHFCRHQNSSSSHSVRVVRGYGVVIKKRDKEKGGGKFFDDDTDTGRTEILTGCLCRNDINVLCETDSSHLLSSHVVKGVGLEGNDGVRAKIVVVNELSKRKRQQTGAIHHRDQQHVKHTHSMRMN